MAKPVQLCQHILKLETIIIEPNFLNENWHIKYTSSSKHPLSGPESGETGGQLGAKNHDQISNSQIHNQHIVRSPHIFTPETITLKNEGSIVG